MFMKKYQLLNTFQWLLMTLFFLFFIMGCDDDEKVREEEEKITMERINWLLNWMQKILLHPSNSQL